MMRRLVRFLLGLSLLISLVSLILLPFSYYYAVSTSYAGWSTTGHLGFGGGQAIWLHQSGPGMRDIFAAYPELRPGFREFRAVRDRTHYFDFNRNWLRSMRPTYRNLSFPQKSGTVNQLFISLPLWLTAWVFAIPPAIVYQHHRRRRQLIRQGLCLSCGYDLRASGDRCPECGAMRPTASNGTERSVHA